jgi:hypothetical protein
VTVAVTCNASTPVTCDTPRRGGGAQPHTLGPMRLAMDRVSTSRSSAPAASTLSVVDDHGRRSKFSMDRNLEATLFDPASVASDRCIPEKGTPTMNPMSRMSSHRSSRRTGPADVEDQKPVEYAEAARAPPRKVDWLPPILGLFPVVLVIVWTIAVFTKSGKLVGGVMGSDTLVYDLDPGHIISLAGWAGLCAELGMAAVVLTRVTGPAPGVLHPGIRGIWKAGEDLPASSDSDSEDEPELDLTPKQQRMHDEEISQMSHVLSLLIGPFAIMLVTMSCLVVVLYGLIQDPFGHAINRDFKTSLEASPNDHAGLRDQEFACTSPIGYFGTISGVSANILSEGYVFMFVGITVNAVIVLQNMPTYVARVLLAV